MVAQVAKWSLRVVFVLVVARALGPERLGIYALLYALVEFLAVASGAGYSDYLTREAAKDASSGWGLAFQLMALRVAIAVPIAAIEIGILSLMRYPHAVLAGTAWMALAVVPRSISEAVQGVLRGIHEYASFLAIELILGGSLVAGAVVLLVRHGGLSLVIAVEVLAAAAAALAGLWLSLKYRTRERVWVSVSQLVKKGAVFNLYSLAASLYDRFDVVLLSKLAGNYAAGIYSVAYRALSMTQIIGYGVLYSLLPTLSQGAMGQIEQRRLEKATGLLLRVAFFVVLATMIFAGPIVAIVLGPQYAESAGALKILIWAVVFRYLNYALNVGLLAGGRERVFVSTSLICLAVNLIGNLVFIPMYSWRAAAAVTIATEMALLVQNLYWMRRAVGRVRPPSGLLSMSLVFASLLALAMAGGYLGAPFVVGTGCIALFAVYLYQSGIRSDFFAVWSEERVR